MTLVGKNECFKTSHFSWNVLMPCMSDIGFLAVFLSIFFIDFINATQSDFCSLFYQ